MHPTVVREEAVPEATTPTPVLERLRQAACDHGEAPTSAAALVGWARAFILFYDKRHPATLGLREVTRFLEHVVQTETEPLVAYYRRWIIRHRGTPTNQVIRPCLYRYRRSLPLLCLCRHRRVGNTSCLPPCHTSNVLPPASTQTTSP